MSALLPIYLLLKYAAYSAWCFYGLRLSSSGKTPSVSLAAGLGLVRLLIGFGLGIFIWSMSTKLYIAASDAHIGGRLIHQALAYLGVYVPTRWFEWAVIAWIVFPSSRSVTGFLFGGTATERYWRLCGIGVSCLADLPLILDLGGLPLGRFLC